MFYLALFYRWESQGSILHQASVGAFRGTGVLTKTDTVPALQESSSSWEPIQTPLTNWKKSPHPNSAPLDTSGYTFNSSPELLSSPRFYSSSLTVQWLLTHILLAAARCKSPSPCKQARAVCFSPCDPPAGSSENYHGVDECIKEVRHPPAPTLDSISSIVS